MDEQKILELKTRSKFIYYRLRNIVYYRGIDNRPRAQYMHVLRSLRQDAKEVLDLGFPSLLEYPDKELLLLKIFLKEVVKYIPVKVKTEECSDVIKKLEGLLNVKQQKKKGEAGTEETEKYSEGD